MGLSDYFDCVDKLVAQIGAADFRHIFCFSVELLQIA